MQAKRLLSVGVFLTMVVLFLTMISALDLYGSGSSDTGADIEASGQGSNTNGNTNVGVDLGSDVTVSSNIDIDMSTGSPKIILSNGDETFLKITSEQAKTKASSELEINDCSNCTVELVEIKANGENRAAYKVTTYKKSKMFGIFRTNMDVSANIDIQTGEVISVKKPWWTFLSVESKTSASAGQ